MGHMFGSKHDPHAACRHLLQMVVLMTAMNDPRLFLL